MRSHCARMPAVLRYFLLTGVTFLLAMLASAHPRQACADDMQWIWSPAQNQEKNVPPGTVYFRRSFPVNAIESGEVQITCDNAYELYVNGRQAGEGDDWHILKSHDITKLLTPGRNTVAIKAIVKNQGNAGLAARIVIKEVGGTYVAYNSDSTWRTSLQEFPNWTKHYFNDVQWLVARTIGPFGTTPPWLDDVHAAGGAPAGRFETLPEFRVETVLQPNDTRSLLGMTFNEFGDILLSREGGGIYLARDIHHDGKFEKPELFADQVKNCQGLLALNGQVFVVGMGPDGEGLYRLEATQSDTNADKVVTLLKFTGGPGEHGPHAVTLGPDGLLYVVLGNHTQLATPADATSPLHHFYEGDLLTPKYEDPHGHAAGIKSPCGTIVRTDVNATTVELFAGGLRNCYDITFNRAGELFTWDSDMEWDVGLPWYRPTRVLHLVPGGEYGSRSGWSVWPDYYFDSLPSVIDTARGSPTGMVVYSHLMFPKRYHDALFVGDWSRGRILAIRLKQQGGTYKGDVETFATGKPLNVTNLAVGPDGALYFCTGGRDSEGGVYKIVWRGRVPPEVTDPGQGIQQALRQPQLNSAFARQHIAEVKQKMGGAWDEAIVGILDSPNTSAADRLRALDLMQLFGPFPSGTQLARAAGDPDPEVRAKAAFLMGLHMQPITRSTLIKLLADRDAIVQRVACEALLRGNQKPSYQQLAPLLASENRAVAYAATRLLETLPRDEYRTATLEAKSTRTFLQGALALLTMDPDRETCLAILERAGVIMKGFVSDRDFVDLLRVAELALVRGELKRDDLPQLAEKLALEYPTKNASMNRELVRLIAYLQCTSAAGRLMEQLASNIPNEDKIQIALYARFLDNWSTDQKLALLKYYETARTAAGGGHSYEGYIDNVSRDLFAGLTEKERSLVLADAAKWPSSALAVLAKLPEDVPTETIQQIIDVDRQMATVDSEPARKLGIGVVFSLSRSHDPAAAAYLREAYEKYPERRGHIAMALTQNPDGDNWPVLVQSLSYVEGAFAQEVLIALSHVNRTPDKPEPFRQVILRGLKLGKSGGANAVKLLEHWTGQQFSGQSDKLDDQLAACQKWFSETYPDQPEPKLPVESAENKWTYDELIAYLNSAEGSRGHADEGQKIFAKQCANCHRFGERGEGIGPDLSTVSQRFQKKEILESILYPSLVISDQYASKTILTTDGRNISGLCAPQADGSLTVLQNNGQKVTIAANQIDQTIPCKISAMPEGLLNTLSLEDIANLFAYLNRPPQQAIITSRPAATGVPGNK
jgi:putative heme-binding domain-containing protein